MINLRKRPRNAHQCLQPDAPLWHGQFPPSHHDSSLPCLVWGVLFLTHSIYRPPSTKRSGQRQQFLHRLFDPPGKHDVLLFNFLLWCCLCFDPSFCRLICILVVDISTSGNSALLVEQVLPPSHQDFFSPSIGTRVSCHRIPVSVTGVKMMLQCHWSMSRQPCRPPWMH